MADIEPIEKRQGRTARAWPAALSAELLDQLADAILVADTEGHYVEANLAATTLLGYSRAELLSMGVADVTVGPPGWSQSEYVRFSKDGYWRGMVDLRRKDGSSVRRRRSGERAPDPRGSVGHLGPPRSRRSGRRGAGASTGGSAEHPAARDAGRGRRHHDPRCRRTTGLRQPRRRARLGIPVGRRVPRRGSARAARALGDIERGRRGIPHRRAPGPPGSRGRARGRDRPAGARQAGRSRVLVPRQGDGHLRRRGPGAARDQPLPRHHGSEGGRTERSPEGDPDVPSLRDHGGALGDDGHRGDRRGAGRADPDGLRGISRGSRASCLRTAKLSRPSPGGDTNPR